MNTEPHRIVGRVDTPRSEAKCINCGQPFKFGKRGEAGANVFTQDGHKEIAISGTCEACFDSFFEDDE